MIPLKNTNDKKRNEPQTTISRRYGFLFTNNKGRIIDKITAEYSAKLLVVPIVLNDGSFV